MPSQYGQFCPVAKAMELLDERWTLLVVRELMMGSRHFNALRRGVPRMSPALLSKRLQTLARAGVVERWQEGNRVSYRLTEAGRELEPIVEAVGRWGVRWIPELGDEDLTHAQIADRLQLPPGLGQGVGDPWAVVAPLDHAGPGQGAQPLGQQRRRHPRHTAPQRVEVPTAQHQLLDDEQRPALVQELHRLGHRAELAVLRGHGTPPVHGTVRP